MVKNLPTEVLPSEHERMGIDANVFIYFLGNDRGLERVKEMKCIILDEIT